MKRTNATVEMQTLCLKHRTHIKTNWPFWTPLDFIQQTAKNVERQ